MSSLRTFHCILCEKGWRKGIFVWSRLRRFRMHSTHNYFATMLLFVSTPRFFTPHYDHRESPNDKCTCFSTFWFLRSYSAILLFCDTMHPWHAHLIFVSCIH